MKYEIVFKDKGEKRILEAAHAHVDGGMIIFSEAAQRGTGPGKPFAFFAVHSVESVIALSGSTADHPQPWKR